MVLATMASRIEAVEGVTRLARSTIPRQAAAKVEAAHAEAEFWEDALRRERLALGDPKQRRCDARRAIEAVLERYRREGHLAGVVAGPGGRPMLVIVRGGEAPPALPKPPAA